MASGVRVKTLEEALEIMKELDSYLEYYSEDTSEGN